ncbi:MAG: hypothetical protein ACXW2P_07520 [Thermoanaerobaculia bacterium]
MATANSKEADDRGTKTRRNTSSSKRRTAATAGLSSAALFDIVNRLGVVDLLVDRVKSRLEEVEVDDILDEIRDYLKRNPEVMVVALGAITIAAGALVYLNKRNERPAPRETAQPKTKKSSR